MRSSQKAYFEVIDFFLEKKLLLHEKDSYSEYVQKIWDINNKKNPEKLKFKDISLLIGSLL